MLVKDEADVIEATIRHLAGQVDEVIVADNLSTDGTTDILRDLATDGLPVMVVTDPEPGYFQSRKTTQLALAALDRGHGWVVPCDADELWYSPDGRRVADVLSVSPAAVVEATIFNHVPTGTDDPAETNPFRRLRWRLEAPGRLPKVAARLTPTLVIEQGNHGAGYDNLHGGVDYAGRVRVPRPTLRSGGLEIRHFSWRSAEQYLRKIRNGEVAYAATDLPDDIGGHWRAFAGKPDQAVVDHFYRWFYVADPTVDPHVYDDDGNVDSTIVFDPAPVEGEPPVPNETSP